MTLEETIWERRHPWPATDPTLTALFARSVIVSETSDTEN